LNVETRGDQGLLEHKTADVLAILESLERPRRSAP
jgi:hypothetical protein